MVICPFRSGQVVQRFSDLSRHLILAIVGPVRRTDNFVWKVLSLEYDGSVREIRIHVHAMNVLA